MGHAAECRQLRDWSTNGQETELGEEASVRRRLLHTCHRGLVLTAVQGLKQHDVGTPICVKSCSENK